MSEPEDSRLPDPEDSRLTDPLTGLSNRWHFRTFASTALAAADRGVPFTIVLLEIDGYRMFREDSGGELANEALRHFANLLDSTSRETDLIARLHGCRFLSLLRDCDRRGGRIYAERVHRQTRSLEHEYGLTVSIGLAAHEDGIEDAAVLLRMAEDALEEALQADGRVIRIAPSGSSSAGSPPASRGENPPPGRSARTGKPAPGSDQRPGSDRPGGSDQPPESDPSESER